jgi:tRNA (guanine37-N1)-methyltransferase
MQFEVITLFPEMFESFLRASLLGKAIASGLLGVTFTNPRDFTTDKHRSVDDAPYGGGAGMVMRAEPLVAAIEAVTAARGPARRVLLTPAGSPLTHDRVRALSGHPRVLLVCGRYEGIDERVRQLAIDEELSIGDFVLSGGEVAAMAVIDAVSRLVPGVLGDPASAEEESFARGLLEAPCYTRPPELRGLRVPEVLLSGDHGKIRAWREAEGRSRTRRTRPDLLPDETAARTYVCLLHHPVLDKEGQVVTTAVTNLDIHDIARASRTFGLAGYFVVTPIELQQKLVARIVGHWTEGAGREHTTKRTEALELVSIVPALADAIARVTERHGVAPYVAATGARPRPDVISPPELLQRAGSRPLLLLFGTGWGLASDVFMNVDSVLAPIAGAGEYNHLSVRSAVAIILDRLLGFRERF